MRNLLRKVLCLTMLYPMMGQAQLVVDREKYPDYSETLNPDTNLITYGSIRSLKGRKTVPLSDRPDHVNNTDLKFFPPIFNQDGGSCGSASRICYMFTHELNAYRNLDGSLPANYYPSHFVWLLTNGNSGKDEFVQHIGVPSAELYGGQTYSSLFGYQEETNDDFGWMTGYDKWYAAMFNRMLRPTNMSESLGTQAGREALKNWLWNHNGDSDFYGGGVVGIGVASGGDWQRIGKTAANDEAGVTGLYYVNHWGASVDHALTIVGYDDRVEFDLNGNGIYGEESADEVGAWIIVNSWGSGWCNSGTIYCPYAYAGSYSIHNESTDQWRFSGAWWYPEVYWVRKDYRPLRTIKLLMDYSRRSELYLSAGISPNLQATAPDRVIAFEHFKYAGDGANGNTNPAPEIPMLGRWADGKLHDEPMEFGYDLTDLTAGFDKSQPLKYFFIVNTREWGLGSGHIYGASIIDYEEDAEGVEMPFDLGETGNVEIKSAGAQTIISLIVYGQQYYAPQNLAFTAGTLLSWQEPQASCYTVTSYNIRKDGTLIATLDADARTFETSDLGEGCYSVTAMYEGERESAAISVSSPVTSTVMNRVVNFQKSGFSIPNVFDSKMDEATLEFWIQPTTLSNWNQTGGPGWGQFMFHANSDGSFTAGWNTTSGDRSSTPAGSLALKSWVHVAIVVNKNTMKTYINGVEAASCTSSSYSGIGGFGDLVFTANTSSNSNTDAGMDEIRIWNYARTADQIKNHRKVEYVGELFPEGLVAYYKGNVFEQDGTTYLRDCCGGNHAAILNGNFTTSNTLSHTYSAPSEALAAAINVPTEPVYVGLPVTLTVDRSESVNSLSWTAEGTGVQDLHAATVTLLFKEAGEQNVHLVAANTKTNKQVEVDCKLTVLETVAPDASFTLTASEVSAGERVSFIVDHPTNGCLYEWSMPGADKETAKTINAAATYSTFGEHTVTLTVTAPDGQKTSVSKQVNVIPVAPQADFAVTPTVVVKGSTAFLQDASKYSPSTWKWYLHSAQKDFVANGKDCSIIMEEPGVYDVTLEVTNEIGTNTKTGERGLIVVNADSKNGLNFSQTGARVTAASPLTKSQTRFTMEWWMRPNKLSDYCLGIGDSESTMFVKTSAAGAMILYVNSKSVYTADGFVIAGQWHHYAITFSMGTVNFFRDGVLMATRSMSGALAVPALSQFSIGSPAADMNGSIDEFRVWGSNLSLEGSDGQMKLLDYINQPLEGDLLATAESVDNLKLYYSFNQNGGDVQDLSSNANAGIRSGFGPDGDAWGLSKGVFCLNFDTKEMVDVTADYLSNYRKPFAYNALQQVNNQQSKRWFAITDWTLENTVVEGDITSGVHVDLQKNTCFTSTSGWDGFSNLADHKTYQTVTLPAGAYTLNAVYDVNYEGVCGNSYLAVAEGVGLPGSDELAQSALGYVAMQEKANLSDRTNSLSFFLSEPTTVSLGMVINMSGRKLMAIEQFTLLRSDVTVLQADNVIGYDLAVSESCLGSLYLSYPVLLPEGVTAYVVSEIDESKQQVTLSPVTDRILPAYTGVVIQAEAPGTYHFAPAESTNALNSLLAGVLEDTTPEENVNYMVPGADQEPSFVNLSTTDDKWLRAHRVYFTTSEATSAYSVNLIPVKIDRIEADVRGESDTIYDLFGRRLTRITKPGVYIVGGKKMLVK